MGREIETGFKQHCKKSGLKSREFPTKGEGTYQKVYWKWIEANHKGVFKNFEQFKAVKTFTHQMDKIKVFSQYSESCCDKCDFTNPLLNINTLIQVNRDIVLSVYENFADTVPHEHLCIMILVVLRYCRSCT